MPTGTTSLGGCFSCFLSLTTEACRLTFFKFHQLGLEEQVQKDICSGLRQYKPKGNFLVPSLLWCGPWNRRGREYSDTPNLLLGQSKFGDNSTNQKTCIEYNMSDLILSAAINSNNQQCLHAMSQIHCQMFQQHLI